MTKRKLAAAFLGLMVAAGPLAACHTGDKADDAELGHQVVRPTTADQERQAAGSDPTAPTATPEPADPEESETPPPPAPEALVTPAKADSVLLPLDVTGGVVGAVLNYEQRFKTPLQPYPLGNQASCAVLFGLNTAALGNDYTAFRAARQQESKDNCLHVVQQDVVTYPDAQTAAKVFQAAFQPVGQCNDVAVHRPSDDQQVTWKFEVQGSDPASAAWRNVELNGGNPNGWSCSHGARVKNNVIFSTRVCERSDSGPAVPTILDRMAKWIPA